MSVINPLWLAAMKRQWPLVGAIFLFLLFTLVHVLAFQPTVARYEQAVRRAGELGVSEDPATTTQVMPPRVFAMLAENAMAPADAQRDADSGAMSAALLEDLTRIASRQGLEVLSTEPGPVVQAANAVHVRARLQLAGDYFEFVGFLRALAQSGRLYAVDRFSFQSSSRGDLVEVWLSRYVLKQSGASR